MAKRVIIDAEECIGCESCVELCSEVFTFNEAEEKAEVILPVGGCAGVAKQQQEKADEQGVRQPGISLPGCRHQ